MNSEILNYPIHRHLKSSLLGKFIGRNGININNIERSNGVALEIWKNDDQNSFVRITGPYWNLKSALNDVLTLVSTIRDDNQQYTIEIPSRDVGFLIGKNGAKINEIKLSSNVDIHFEKKNDTDDVENEKTSVAITGNYQQILTGLRLIYDRLNSKGQKTLYDDPRTQQFAESFMDSL